MDESSRRPRQVDGDGAAKRRRLRRLRSWWRHEQQTVAAVLATFQHHSAPRGPRTVRTGEGARDELFGYAPEDAHPQAAGTQYFAMDVDDVPAAGSSRPDRLSEVRPQERAQRRTVQQIVDPVPLPTLDDPAPQMVGQLLNLAHFLDTLLPDPEQVIEVPKMLSDDVPMRALVRETQLAEQLVEVPTIVSWSLVQLITKQNVDIPCWWRPSRFSPRTELICIFFISSWCSWFRRCAWGWGFSHFSPKKKSAKLCSHSGSELLPESSPSMPAAHVDALSGVELLAKFQQLSDQVEATERTYSFYWQGFSNDIEMLYRLITDAEHRLEQLEAWADEVAGDDDGPG